MILSNHRPLPPWRRHTRGDGAVGDDEVAVEWVEFVCDGLTLSNP